MKAMDILKSCRQSMLSEESCDLQARCFSAADEIERLRSAIATAYGYLWCVNNEPDTPRRYPPQRAAYEARKVLRELLTKEQRGAAINQALTLVHEAVRIDDLLGPNV